MPTPMPAASATGSSNAGTAAQPAERRDDDGGDEHRGARGRRCRSISASLGDAVGEHDVEREQRRRWRTRSATPERLAREVHAGEQVDAGDGERERGDVARRARAERGQHDHRAGTRSRRRCRAAAGRSPGRSSSSSPPARRPRRAAARPSRSARRTRHGPAPEREDERGRGDPQPRDAEHVDAGEQQHGERGPEVVEDGADDEVGVRAA